MGISNKAEIHKTAIIDPEAVVEAGAYVGPYCCVGKDVVIRENARLESHVVVSGNTVVGSYVSVYPFAALGFAPQDLKYHNEQSRLEIGEHTVIREGVTASIGTESGGMVTRIGKHCLIMAYCHIAHDCWIGDHVILTNGANLSGHVQIGDFAIIGGMCAIKQFVRIGKHAMIGGFTGVDRDVIPYGLVRGKRTTTLRGINIIGLKRRNFSLEDISAIRAVYEEIFESADCLTFSEKLKIIAEKYKGNEFVLDIVEFMSSDSKNAVCSVVPLDRG
jgi:UDP-N-acetylglucosamine acyltransferase